MPRFLLILLFAAVTAFASPAHAQKDLPPELKQEWAQMKDASPQDKMTFALKLTQLSYPHEGIYWIEQAARQGHAPAQTALRNVLQNMIQQTDLPFYKYKLGKHMLEGTFGQAQTEQGVAMMHEAASAGVAPALYELGYNFYYGKYGLEKSLDKAIPYLEHAAAKNDSRAMLLLGTTFSDPRTDRHDPVKTEKYLGGAAEHGNALAAFSLGSMYLHGANGLEEDPARAEELFIDSIRGGDARYLLEVAKAYQSDIEKGDNAYNAMKWANAYLLHKTTPVNAKPDESGELNIKLPSTVFEIIKAAKPHISEEQKTQSVHDAEAILENSDKLSLKKKLARMKKQIAEKKAEKKAAGQPDAQPSEETPASP